MPEEFTPRIVRCPRCGGDSVYSPTNAFRPFCSNRCKNHDLGAWANEEFHIPAPLTDPDGPLDA